MSNNYSLTMIVPASDVEAANAYTDAMKQGAMFTVPLSPDGQLPVTHYGCHTFETAEYVATIEAAKVSDDPVLDALNNLYTKAEISEVPLWAEALLDHTPALQRYEEPVQGPE